MVEREISCGTIIFKRKNNKIFYLLLYKKASRGYRESWDFPKGNIEPGESEQETAAREAKEEAGITELVFLPKFKETIKIFYRKEGKLIVKEITFFLAETKQEQVKISFEHNDYRWASFNEALKLLTFKNSKDILTKAHNFLQNRPKQKTLI